MKQDNHEQNRNDYFRGRKDCREGVPHEDGKGKWYDHGYSRQYEYEQKQEETT